MMSRKFLGVGLVVCLILIGVGALNRAQGQALVLTCASNATVECGTSWDFTPPEATIFFPGPGLSITIKSTVTNALCGSTFQATRTWEATDSSSNTASCSQTITVVDTTPPVLAGVSNITVECGLDWSFVDPTATDLCDGSNVTVSVIGTTTNALCGSTFAATRTWQATDGCSNSSFFTQTVTIVDTTAPQITCPPKLNAAESPRDSGSATVSFPNAPASDTCDANPTVYSVPVSGSSFPVGSNTVTFVAVDACGNSNTCDFTVRVIPYRLYVTNLADSGPGSLRQAILDANDSPDENLVLFSLTGDAPFVIPVPSPLPEITSPIIIDGWSQGGSNSPPVVVLDGGGGSNAADGLVISVGNSTVRGLAMRGFGTAIRLQGVGTNLVYGNYIGSASDPLAGGNNGDGIAVSSDKNIIGGLEAGFGNVISGNGGNGVVIYSDSASNNLVMGNLIGTLPDGINPLPNGVNGVLLMNNAFKNRVGGALAGTGNVIAFNGRNGVALAADAGTRNGILENLIFSNGALGIDLGDDGVTLNDPGDTDSGPNNLQNFPVITSANSVNGVLTISGTLDSIADLPYRLEFFLDDVADPSGYGPGQTYLGFINIAVHGNAPEPFNVSFTVPATFTQFVSATASTEFGDTSEFAQTVPVTTPPLPGTSPVSTNVTAGSSVTFCASATGTPPIFYQWRLNGGNIPGATNSCYTVPDAEATNGGVYTVLIGNGLGAFAADPATLTVPVTNGTPGADMFADRVTLTGMIGSTAGDNSDATSEPGEPLHAGKPGGKSVWYTWTPTVTGVATFTTRGSGFDTLLAIYSGSTVSNLTEEASDNDRGGNYTSLLQLNGIIGREYQIAIDGFSGASGDYVMQWQQVDDPHLVPFYTLQPQSQTIPPGSNVTFTAVAVRVCGHGEHDCVDPSHYPEGVLPNLFYQWYFEGNPIAGATTNSLTINNVGPDSVGKYFIRISTLWQSAQSDDASLQLNLTGVSAETAQAFDKLGDALFSNDAIVIGNPIASAAITVVSKGGGNGDASADATTVVSSFTGTQVFNTGGSSTDPTETICGVIGGSSEWLAFVPQASGTLFLNTDGSSYDTVMAVFRRSPTNAALLELLGCDNNSGTNGKSSSVTVPVVSGVTNYIDVDGVGGVSGVLQLNYSLATTAIIKLLDPTPQGQQHLLVSSRTNAHFAIQATSNMFNWDSLITTIAPTGVFDYVDTVSTNFAQRCYRVLLLP